MHCRYCGRDVPTGKPGIDRWIWLAVGGGSVGLAVLAGIVLLSIAFSGHLTDRGTTYLSPGRGVRTAIHETRDAAEIARELDTEVYPGVMVPAPAQSSTMAGHYRVAAYVVTDDEPGKVIAFYKSRYGSALDLQSSGAQTTLIRRLADTDHVVLTVGPRGDAHSGTGLLCSRDAVRP